MYIEYKIIPHFYIVRTYDSRGEEMDSSSQEESSESSIEETDENEGWGPIIWVD